MSNDPIVSRDSDGASSRPHAAASDPQMERIVEQVRALLADLAGERVRTEELHRAKTFIAAVLEQLVTTARRPDFDPAQLERDDPVEIPSRLDAYLEGLGGLIDFFPDKRRAV